MRATSVSAVTPACSSATSFTRHTSFATSPPSFREPGAYSRRDQPPRVCMLSMAIRAGNLAKADELLAAVEQRQTAALGRLALNAAETSAQRGQLALTRLRHLEAAQHFATAALRVPSGQEDRRLAYLEQEADALYQQGDEFGDNTALRSAIERWRQIFALRPREWVPLERS